MSRTTQRRAAHKARKAFGRAKHAIQFTLRRGHQNSAVRRRIAARGIYVPYSLRHRARELRAVVTNMVSLGSRP